MNLPDTSNKDPFFIKKVIEYEFDQFPHKKGTCFIREDSDLESEVVVKIDNEEHVILKTSRDQWGVFINAGPICVAQEDCTRSFIDGLIKCLQELRTINEHETINASLTPKTEG